MKKIIIILLCLIVCGCNSIETENKNNNMKEIKEIMLNNEYVIIDVRTKEEYESGHIIDSINIPYDEIDKSVKIDKNNIIFVYCKSGNRSNIAYQSLKSLGYTVYDLGAYQDIDLPKE